MELMEQTYRMLLVSSSQKTEDVLMPLFKEHQYTSVTTAYDIASARRLLVDEQYDFVLINSPLPDEFGTRFALDIAAQTSAGVLMLVKSQLYHETLSRVQSMGVMVLSKPTNSQMIAQSLDLMHAMRHRIKRMEQKTASIEEKMEEIRLVNQAKWVLVDVLKMTEPDAHRFIQKSAMDRGLSRLAVAESIIRTYK